MSTSERTWVLGGKDQETHPEPPVGLPAGHPTGNGSGNGYVPEGAYDRFGFTQNDTTRRIELLLREAGYVSGGEAKKDLAAECDFPDLPQEADYWSRMARRNPTAAKVVEFMPKQCWARFPVLYESDDPDAPLKPFEVSWKNLKVGAGPPSHLKAVDGAHPVLSVLSVADSLSRVGRFGIVHWGFDDQRPQSEPVRGYVETGSVPDAVRPADVKATGGTTPTEPSRLIPSRNEEPGSDPHPEYGLTINAAETRVNGKLRRLLFANPYPEKQVEVAEWETNPASDRYGMPTAYNVQTVDPDTMTGRSNKVQDTIRVHWTRVTHLADWHHTPCADRLFCVPACEPVYRPLLGLEKISAGTGEGFWKSALPLKFLELLPALVGVAGGVNRTVIQEMTDKIDKGLQKWGVLEGLTAKTLPPALLDPTPYKDFLQEEIALKLHIPVRIFKGSERGELASGQDKGEANAVFAERCTTYLTPDVVGRAVSHLINAGCLYPPESKADPDAGAGPTGNLTKAPDAGSDDPPPSSDSQEDAYGFGVDWPDRDEATPGEKAEVFAKRMEALVKAVTPGMESLMSPFDVLTREAGYSDEEADAIVEAASEFAEEKQQADVELQKQQIKEGVLADPTSTGPEKPVPVKPGDKLVKPSDGKVIAKGNPIPKKPPTKNESNPPSYEVEDYDVLLTPAPE